MSINNNSIVTLDFNNQNSSNTYLVDRVIKYNSDKEDEVLIYHPLYPSIFLNKKISELNIVSSNIKDSTERSLDFASRHKDMLDINMICDLDALCMYFVVTRRLTKKQKLVLSTTCGFIACKIFHDNINKAMDFTINNKALLDDFNLTWYNNFKDIFERRRSITSKKQKTAIFNIAGFLLAELKSPQVLK